MRIHGKFLAGLLAAFALSTAWAQTGAIRVKVVDGTDKSPMQGVTIILRNSMQYVATTTVLTNKDGIAEFPVLRAGAGYSVEASFISYAKQVQANLKVSINQVLQVNFVMTQEMVEREVVKATRETVDLEKNQTSTKFGEDFIQDLPVQGRFYQNVLTMAAGVQDPDGDGNPNVNGARDVDFKMQVGGVSNQDPLTGQQMSQVNPDSIEEIEIITAGAGAEFGRAQGGFGNIIQKQGSNDFEGSFNILYRSNLLDGNAASFPGAPKAEYEQIEPAITISGPIVRDKVWYRLSHDYIKADSPVDTGAEVAVVKTRQQVNSDSITWQVSPRNKLAFQYDQDPLTITNWGVSQLTPVESAYRRETGGPAYKVSWTAPFSAKILVDSLVSYQNHHSNIMPTTSGVTNNCVQSASVDGAPALPFIEEAQCTNLETGQTSGSGYRTFRSNSQRLTVKSTASIFGGRFWGMDHQFKVGLSVENERYFQSVDRKPNIYFYIYRPMSSNSNQTNNNQLEPIAVTAGNFAVPEVSEGRATSTATSLFVEDVVKPRQNLSITIGLRLDREAINARGYAPFDPAAEEDKFYTLREQYARQYADSLVRNDPALSYSAALAKAYSPEANGVVQYPAKKESFTAYEGIADFARQLSTVIGTDANALLGTIAKDSQEWINKRRPDNIALTNLNPAPRLSISWDPWSDGKTKFAATAGRLYGTVPLIIPLSETQPTITSLRFQSKRQGGVWVTSQSAGLNPAANIEVFDRSYTTPYTDEWTLAFERELWTETSMKITYINKQYVDQPQDLDLNHYPADYGKCRLQLDPKAQPNTTGLPWMEVNYDDHGRPIGDGIQDDCDGKLEVPFVEDTGGAGSNNTISDFSAGFNHRPDDYLDTYTHNLAWGGVYLVGNFNTATYHGWQLELTRRQYRNWQMTSSYTYSKAIGDAEDWASYLGDDRTTRENERGYLSYDVRHALKVNATTITPWGFRFGTAISWQSGLPYSLLEQAPSQDTTPPPLISLGQPEPRYRQKYITGQRNDQRNRARWNFDVKFDKEMNLGKGLNLQLAADIFNLLNDRTYVVYNDFTQQGVQLNGRNDAYRRVGRQYQLTAKLSF